MQILKGEIATHVSPLATQGTAEHKEGRRRIGFVGLLTASRPLAESGCELERGFAKEGEPQKDASSFAEATADMEGRRKEGEGSNR